MRGLSISCPAERTEGARVRWSDLKTIQKLCALPLAFAMFIIGLIVILAALAIVAAPVFAAWYFFVRSQ